MKIFFPELANKLARISADESTTKAIKSEKLRRLKLEVKENISSVYCNIVDINFKKKQTELQILLANVKREKDKLCD